MEDGEASLPAKAVGAERNTDLEGSYIEFILRVIQLVRRLSQTREAVSITFEG